MKTRLLTPVQQLARALMLPIAVLPIAGLLLRLGQPDLLGVSLIAKAGEAVFANLPIIFSVGVAVGFAREGHGAAGLAGAIGYLVLSTVMKTFDEKNDMGVLAGIVTGVVAGMLYNRYKDLRLPDYLSFFGGKRFVVIASGLACLGLGLVFGVAWSPVQHGIDSLGHWLLGAGAAGLFAYGLLNRLLLVTGLHHVLNSLVWFVFGAFTAGGKVVHGDLSRFFAGDPSAGRFMTGFYPVMMFGLPAACLAMYHSARRKKGVGGLLLSMGLTSFLTGVTEPVEFTFMFRAPLLYLLHAVMTGVSMAFMDALGVRLGFTFSAGGFDYLLGYGLATNAWLLLPVGAAYGLVYYGIFRWAIERYDLQTPGREPAAVEAGDLAAGGERGAAFVLALGGAENLLAVDACMTRLRLSVADNERIDDAALTALGARGLVRPAAGSVQVVVGPQADQLADAIRAALRGSATGIVDRAAWLAALGGADNVKRIEVAATTRLRVELASPTGVDEVALGRLGAQGVMPVSEGVVHVVVGAKAEAIAQALRSDS